MENGKKEHTRSLFSALLLVLVSYSALIAQSPDTVWTKTYGTDYWDECREVVQTPDGGFVFAGRTVVGGNDVAHLMKIDEFGNTIWENTYDVMGRCHGWAMDRTADGGYLITGRTADSASGDYYVPIIRADSLGDTLWTRVYGGLEDDYGWSVRETPDGGCIVAGETASYGNAAGDVFLIRTDSLGDTLWTKTYGGNNWEVGNAVQNTSDGGFVIAAGTGSFGQNGDIWIIKTDAQGDTLWTKVHGWQGFEAAYSIWQTPDEGYIIAGETTSFTVQFRDIFLMKLNSLGDSLWLKIYGGDDTDRAYSLYPTSDGGFVIGGSTNSFGAWSTDFYIIRTDSLGDTLWTKIIGWNPNEADRAYAIWQTNDGGYIVGGRTEKPLLDYWDAYLVRLEPDPPPGKKEREAIPVTSRFSVSAFPNPFRTKLQIVVKFEHLFESSKIQKVKIFDCSGRCVRTISLRPGGHTTQNINRIFWNGKDNLGHLVPPGIYFINIGRIQCNKVVRLE